MAVNYLLMDNRIRMEKQHKPIDQVMELILDNCQASQITGLSDEFVKLETLSIINVGLTTLKGFPRLPNLKKLALCDNKLSEGLNYLLGCPKLQELNLSGNNFRDISCLEPLKGLRDLTNLDIYNCDITRYCDYKQRVFDLLPNLQLLDSFDRYYKDTGTNIISDQAVEGANKELIANSGDTEPATKSSTNTQQPGKEPQVDTIAVAEADNKIDSKTSPMKEDTPVAVENVDKNSEMICEDIKDGEKVEVAEACQPMDNDMEPKIEECQNIQDAQVSEDSQETEKKTTGDEMVIETEQYTSMDSMPVQDDTVIRTSDQNTTVDTSPGPNTTFDLEPDQIAVTNTSTVEQDTQDDVKTEESTTNTLQSGQQVSSDSIKDDDTGEEQVSADQELSSSGDNDGIQESVIEISAENDSSNDEEAEDSSEAAQIVSNEEDEEVDEEEDFSVDSEESEYADHEQPEEGELLDDVDEEDYDEEQDELSTNNRTIELGTEDEEGGGEEHTEEVEQQPEEEEQKEE